MLCKDWQVYGVLCTFRTGRFIVHCQDKQVYFVWSGQAGVFCMVGTGRRILYGEDRQVYFVWSGQAGVFGMVGTGKRIIFYCQDELM